MPQMITLRTFDEQVTSTVLINRDHIVTVTATKEGASSKVCLEIDFVNSGRGRRFHAVDSLGTPDYKGTTEPQEALDAFVTYLHAR